MNTNFKVSEDHLHRWLDYIPANTRDQRTIIVLPALNTLHSMHCYCEFLASQGFKVRSIKYEGQRERSTAFFTQTKISTVSVEDWIHNIEEACKQLQSQNKPFAALVYSIGAPLLSLLLLRHPEMDLQSVFALAPAVALSKKSHFALGAYRMLASIVGSETGIYPSFVAKEYRAEDFMSYSSYNKPKQLISKIKSFIKTRHPQIIETHWTVLTDPKDLLISSKTLQSQLHKFSFPNTKVIYVKGYGHEFAFKNKDEIPAQVKQYLHEWITHFS